MKRIVYLLFFGTLFLFVSCQKESFTPDAFNQEILDHAELTVAVFHAPSCAPGANSCGDPAGIKGASVAIFRTQADLSGDANPMETQSTDYNGKSVFKLGTDSYYIKVISSFGESSQEVKLVKGQKKLVAIVYEG